MNPKPAYQALDRLINHDWRTNLSVKSDACGQAAVRGFCGRYAVTVTAGNVTRQFEIDLSQGAPARHTLTLKP